jgi:hypothetical protein
VFVFNIFQFWLWLSASYCTSIIRRY